MSTHPPSKGNSGSIEDIPEAIRNSSQSPNPNKVKPSQVVVLKAAQPRSVPIGYLLGLGGVGAVLVAGFFGLSQWQQTHSGSSPQPTTTSGTQSQPSPSATSEQLLGHFPYAVAPDFALELVSPRDSILLRKPAAAAFRQLVSAAGADGVSIVLISGFRNLADQNHLFFDVKQERGQTAKQRAEVSAPPGYSEHHTGYAVDIGDAQSPGANLSQSFEDTAAFHWMQKHAAEFSFELSFPQHNPQGVSYEPWHWRFVGDRESLETFYKARSQEAPR